MLTKDERALPTLIIVAIILILLIGVIGVIGEACPPPTTNASALYAKSGIVTRVDRKTDTVTFADRSGNEWQFTGAEDWIVGDHLAAVMDDCGTETIFDDRVVSVRCER